MALQTINTIQSPNSYKEFIEKYFEDTLEDTLQALANSGNRLGVAGSSVKNNSYNIFDIICAEDSGYSYIDSQNKSNYAVVFNYTGYQYTYQVYNLLTNMPVDANVQYLSESSMIDLNDESLRSLIKNKILVFFGHIADISPNSIIHKTNNILTCIFKCHILNTDPNNSDSAEYLYFQYDTNKNKLIDFINVKNYNERYYILYKLECKDIENNDYSFDCHLFKLSKYDSSDDNENSLEDFIKNYIENSTINLNLRDLFVYNTNLDFENSFSFLNSNFVDFNKLCSIEYLYDSSSIIQFILYHNQQMYPDYDIIHFEDSDLIYHNEESMYFDIDNNSLILRQILNRININDIREFLWMSSSINDLYKYLLDIYNSNYYISSKKQLLLNILKTLYSYINSFYNNSTTSRLYIPYNVLLHYLCSDINELKILYINNVDVIHWNGQDIELSSNHITYYDENIENKIVNYGIDINYNNEFPDVINNIIAYRIYTYPYINKLNTWMINDTDSNVSSYNELLSLNKLIILYCSDFSNSDKNNYDQHVIKLNNISDQDKSNFSKYIEKTFNVNSNYFSSYKNTTIKCQTLVPEITSVNKNYFENAILLIVTDKNNLIKDSDIDYSTNYEGNYVFSLWKCGDSGFEVIIDPSSLNDINGNQYAFDPFGYKLTNSSYANNVLYVQANNNKTAQNINNLTGYDYVVLRNKLAENYNSEYENNLNFIIEYINNLNKNGNNPNYPTEEGKYIQDTAQIVTSNTLYPKYQFETSDEFTLVKYIEERQTIDELINDNIIELYAYLRDNKTWLVSQHYVNEVTKQTSVIKYVPEEQTISNIIVGISDSENYNEYIPDKQDVPSMDSKEILHRNVNVLNRINILGVGYNNTQFTNDTENRWYNAFFGTYFDDNVNKSVLGISTNSTNINVGTDTLFNLQQVKRFNTFDIFRIDNFKTIEFKPSDSIISTKPIIQQQNINDKYNVTSVSCIPIGNIFKNNENSICINLSFNNSTNRYEILDINNLIEFINSNDFDPIYNNQVNNKYLFIQGATFKYSIGQTSNTKLKSFKLLYLNNIIMDKFGLSKTDVDKLNVSNIKCGQNLLLCISANKVSNITLTNSYKNYLFMIITDEQELELLYDDVYIYNHQLNLSMLKTGDTYKFNIKFDDKSLNKYSYSILLNTNLNIYNTNNQTNRIEYYINEYNNSEI